MKKIVILGSTGSIGTSALDVIARHKRLFKVVGLTAQSNAELLAKQANTFRPKLLALGDGSRYNTLKHALRYPQRVLAGMEGISEVASMREADTVLVAISGTQAIHPLIAAIKAKKDIALANKESVVSAGKIIVNMARTRRVNIVPVDSEHNSISQCLYGRDKSDIHKVYLMGTGGPLKDVSANIFDRLKQSRILAHPVWKMGRKISVDSATMMNKGLEVIEASHLFGLHVSAIDVLLHREALIHSMVEFVDGNIIANLFCPDMRLPIFHALNFPKRNISNLPRINFMHARTMSFQRPDHGKFPALELCYDVAKRGGTYPACLNSANEEAVKLYLEKRIAFTEIVKLVKKVLSRHRYIREPSLDEILSVDAKTKEEANRMAARL